MTECGLSPGHDDECVPYTSLKAKRQVSYNQNAVLCPACKKRIRLNNNGKLRVHISGKVGSDKCMGSNAEPLAHPIDFAGRDNIASPKPSESLVFQKDAPESGLFSDLEA
jgi:hypothetical protein